MTINGIKIINKKHLKKRINANFPDIQFIHKHLDKYHNIRVWMLILTFFVD